MKTKVICLTCLAALVCIPAAHASVIMTLEQVGANVVGTGSGTVDLADLSFVISASRGPGIIPNAGYFVEGGGNIDIYFGISGPGSLGSGGQTLASAGTGDTLGFQEPLLVVPQGYRSGTPLSSSATWDNTTLAALGVSSGIYTYTWGSGPDADSLTLYAGVPAPTSVPEPSSALLLTLGTAGLALCKWRKK